ncbi:ABC transporter, substrate-binding protein [Citrifermentans bremense]|uniref:ABC transporter substrate-binding protein n=2 Tax=Geobacteraceae TaxID=213422 RepID=A0ABQ0MIB0_9BACT|nr:MULTISPECIES: MlaD family protein [Geobacteraceae]BCG46746.1 ABC transporter, substrate-binding protein [Citrifermentans bremense]GAW66804.1 ABC transporter substrate-binding protein [Geoanaerobacter pelophilus]
MALSVEKKVGIFFLFGLIILGLLLEVGEKWNPFEKNVPYKTYLTSITGLKVGDPVRLAGVDVGRIKGINILNDKIEINFEVKPGTRIKTDSVAGLRLTNLLGGQFLGLSFGSPNAPLLEPGGVVKGKDVANIDIIVDNLSDVVKDAKQFVNNLDRNQDVVLKKISVMLDENRGNLRDSIANINSITGKMDRGEGSLALLLNERKLFDDASGAVESLKNVAGKIERGEGTLGKLVNDDSVYRDASALIADLRAGAKDLNAGMKDVKEITAKVNSGQGTLGKLVNDETLYTDLRDASKNVKEITQKINSGQGTLGKLVNEDQLYRDTTATLKKAERAMEGLGDAGPISVLGSIVGTLF